MKKPKQSTIELAKEVFNLEAQVEVMRPVVEGYQSKILKELGGTDKDTGELITDGEQAYRLGDEQFKEYLRRLSFEHFTAGYEVKPDYCPLLMIEADLRQAERVLVKAMLGDVLKGRVDLKFETLLGHFKEYRRFIDLSKRLLVNYI